MYAGKVGGLGLGQGSKSASLDLCAALWELLNSSGCYGGSPQLREGGRGDVRWSRELVLGSLIYEEGEGGLTITPTISAVVGGGGIL